MEVQSQARAKPAGNRHPQPSGTAMRSIGKLKHAGFEEGQTRAMAEFVEELVDGTVRPIVQRMDQQFGKVDLRFNQVDQRFEQVDQRFDRVDQRFEQVDQRLEQIDRRFEQADQRMNRVESWMQHIESEMRQGFAIITGQLQLTTGQIRDLAGTVRGMQSRPWLPYLVIGLAFSGLYIAVIGVLLALLSKPFG